MKRLLLPIALCWMFLSSTALAGAGSWFENGEFLHWFQEWTR